MIEDLGECQNTGIRVIMIIANGRTRYIMSRHRNSPDRVFAGIEAHHNLEQEAMLPSRQKVLEEMIRNELSQ